VPTLLTVATCYEVQDSLANVEDLLQVPPPALRPPSLSLHRRKSPRHCTVTCIYGTSTEHYHRAAAARKPLQRGSEEGAKQWRERTLIDTATALVQ
jgi:hypothetical protein